MADLALLHEAGHRPDRVGDRHLRVDPVLVEEVDRLDPEPPQARLAGLRHVVGMAVRAAPLAARAADVAELRADEDPVAPALERAADQLLVAAAAVGVRGVEQRDAELDRPVDRGRGFRVVGPAVIRAHAGAAEADGGHPRSVRPEPPLLHARLPMFRQLSISPTHDPPRHPGARAARTWDRFPQRRGCGEAPTPKRSRLSAEFTPDLIRGFGRDDEVGEGRIRPDGVRIAQVVWPRESRPDRLVKAGSG